MEDESNLGGDIGEEDSLLSQDGIEQDVQDVAQGETPVPLDANNTQQVEYSEFNIPEDATNVAVNEEIMGGFVNLAKELNLSQEQAQKVVEFGAKAMHKAIGDGMEAVTAQVEELKLKWRKEATSDPIVKSELPFAKRVVDRFRDEDFVRMLEETGVGSHKAMIKFMIKVGKAMGEAPLLTDGISFRGTRSEDPSSVASSLYKNKM